MSLSVDTHVLRAASHEAVGAFVPTPHRPRHPIMSDTVGRRDRFLAPGSSWLYLKLYGERHHEDNAIAKLVRPFATDLMDCGAADGRFFIRYADPKTHIRLRFSGNRDRITSEALPRCARWACELVEKSEVDTYDQGTFLLLVAG